jgi:hypothetical protein
MRIYFKTAFLTLPLTILSLFSVATTHACLPPPGGHTEDSFEHVNVYRLSTEVGLHIFERRLDQAYAPGDCNLYVPVLINAYYALPLVALVFFIILYTIRRMYRFLRARRSKTDHLHK